MPWRLPVNRDRPTEPLTEEGIAAVHEGAMQILEELGIAFLNPEAREILAEAGCDVDGEIVRMGRDFVMEMVAKAPRSFTLTPRNPERNSTIRRGSYPLWQRLLAAELLGHGDWPQVSDTREMCANLLKLTQYFNCIHFAGGYPVEPVDIDASAPSSRWRLRQADADRQGECMPIRWRREGSRT